MTSRAVTQTGMTCLQRLSKSPGRVSSDAFRATDVVKMCVGARDVRGGGKGKHLLLLFPA